MASLLLCQDWGWGWRTQWWQREKRGGRAFCENVFSFGFVVWSISFIFPYLSPPLPLFSGGLGGRGMECPAATAGYRKVRHTAGEINQITLTHKKVDVSSPSNVFILIVPFWYFLQDMQSTSSFFNADYLDVLQKIKDRSSQTSNGILLFFSSVIVSK